MRTQPTRTSASHEQAAAEPVVPARISLPQRGDDPEHDSDALMPPVRHGNEVTSILEDGRYHHKIRQSFLGTFLDCPERSRRQITGESLRTDSDSTAVGTALHAAIEQSINLAIDDVWISPADVVDIFDVEWARLQEELDIRWVKRKLGGATAYGQRMSATFGKLVLPELDPYATEVAFGPLTLIEDEQRVVTVTGTIDYVDAKWGICDWKSAAREYVNWEKQRWGAQPLVYTWAFRQIVDGSAPGDYFWSRSSVFTDTFRYVVFPAPGDTVQYVDVTRGAEWDDWLRTQVMSVVHVLEADLPAWVANDQSALCGPKFCDAWATCKGASLVTPSWVQPPNKTT